MKQKIALVMVLALTLSWAAFGGPGRGSEVGNGRTMRSMPKAGQKAGDDGSAPAGGAVESRVLAIQYSALELEAGDTLKARILVRVLKPEAVQDCNASLASDQGTAMAFIVDSCSVEKLDELTYELKLKHKFPKKIATRTYRLDQLVLRLADGTGDPISMPQQLAEPIQVTNCRYSELQLIGASLSESSIRPGEGFELVIRLKSSQALTSAIVSINDTFTASVAGQSPYVLSEDVYLWPASESAAQSLDDGVITLRVPLFVSKTNTDLTELSIQGIAVRNEVLQEAYLAFSQPLVVKIAK